MDYYRHSLITAFIQDLGGSPFSSRFYWLDNEPIGKDNIHLLPQAFAMQIPELPKDKKMQLLKAVDERIGKMEAIGPRIREDFEQNHYAAPGRGENGGFYYVPYAMLILGVNTFDQARASQLLVNMSLRHYAEKFPNY